MPPPSTSYPRDADPGAMIVPQSYLQTTSPVTVIGPQFRSPYPMDLTITKKPTSIATGNFAVTDADGNVVFRVKGDVFSIRDRAVLVDANGNPLLSMREKVLTIHSRWLVFRGDSKDSKEELFSVKKSSLLDFKTQLDVFLAANTSETACDFKIKWSYFDRSCTICLGNSDTILAQMRKNHTVGSVQQGKDTYAITVYPNVDYAFIVALIVILDEITRAGNGED